MTVTPFLKPKEGKRGSINKHLDNTTVVIIDLNTNETTRNRCHDTRAGLELIGWGGHTEQDKANETDAGQVRRERVRADN